MKTFFTVFILTLQTDLAARWCFWISGNSSSIEQVRPILTVFSKIQVFGGDSGVFKAAMSN